jgi:hypothetical protein
MSRSYTSPPPSSRVVCGRTDLALLLSYKESYVIAYIIPNHPVKSACVCACLYTCVVCASVYVCASLYACVVCASVYVCASLYTCVVCASVYVCASLYTCVVCASVCLSVCLPGLIVRIVSVLTYTVQPVH